MTVELLLLVMAVLVTLHALGAGWLTLAGPRDRLWESLALMSTLVTMVAAVVWLLLVFFTRGLTVNALALGAEWAGALVLDALCVVVVRRASPRVAAGVVFLVLFAVPMTPLVARAAEAHHRRTHWNCLHSVVVHR